MQKMLFVLVVGAGITAYGFYGLRTTEFVPEVSTVTLTRGDVVDTVGATGALEAVTTVQVGSQVSGIIEALYADYNSIVREGDVIARLEPSLFETQVEQGRANLARSEAEVERLQVTVEDARAQLVRSEDLSSRDLISTTELEAAQVAVRSAAAQLKSAQASMTQSQAALSQNEVNLGHTVITAPIDGIVIARQVDMGQTVAASMSAPELFIIAADLTKMRVIANIDESDVGRIRPGQVVSFTVDAYPSEEFEGTVSQIRLEPVVLQNVVTYATVIDVPNNELKLKPGMTATVTLEIARRENILRIQNSALRFRPTPDMFAVLNQPVPEILQRGGGGGGSRGGSVGGPRWGPWPGRIRRHERRRAAADASTHAEHVAPKTGRRSSPVAAGAVVVDGAAATEPGAATPRDSAPTKPTIGRFPQWSVAPRRSMHCSHRWEVIETNGRVWVLDADQLRPIEVRLGVTDGTATELLAVRGAGRRTRPGPDPQIAELRQQIGAIDDTEARQNLERMIERLEADSDGAAPMASLPTLAALDEGAQLVTGVTIPDAGSSARSSGGGSPLIPQRPNFGRRR